MKGLLQQIDLATCRYPFAGTTTTVLPEKVERQPAFDTRYPQIINPELILPGPRKAMEEAWKRGRFPEQDLEIFKLSDVFVLNSLVFDQSLRLVENVSDDAGDISEGAREVASRFEAGRITRYSSPCVMVKRHGAGIYGHFLLEMLPIAYIGRMLVGEHDPSYLVHQASAPVQDVMLRGFRLLGFPLHRLVFQNFWEPLWFRELVIIRGLTAHGTYMSPLSVNIMEIMAAKIPPGPHRRIFVRRGVPNGGRLLLNQEDVARRLAARGFHCFNPGEMTLEEQISMFRGADLVVGVAGSSMANLAFCRPGATAVILAPGTFADTFAWFIANLRRLHYLEIRGDQETYEQPAAQSSDFTLREVDIQRLERL
jgi:capsular polysaccharide biosynthesis protein